MRDVLGLRPGDPVHFELDGEVIRMAAAPPPVALRGRFAGLRLTEALEDDRRRERRR